MHNHEADHFQLFLSPLPHFKEKERLHLSLITDIHLDQVVHLNEFHKEQHCYC